MSFRAGVQLVIQRNFSKIVCVFPACLSLVLLWSPASWVVLGLIQLLKIISIETYLWSSKQTTNGIHSIGGNTKSFALQVTAGMHCVCRVYRVCLCLHCLNV